MTDFQKEKCREILEHYGFINQRDILIEECAELIQAISKLKRNGEKTSSNFIEELADVEIMLEQMKQGLSHDEAIEFMTVQSKKIERQIARIKGISEGSVMMNTNDIIKALGCCIVHMPEQCKACPYNDCNSENCVVCLMSDAKDLIKRQQAQIESLEKRFKHLLQSDFIASFDGWDQRKGDYRRDIREADEIIKRQEAEIDSYKSMNLAKLDIIHDLRAEIEALKMDNEQLESDIANALMNADHMTELYNNAIKEFAEFIIQSRAKLFNFIYSDAHFERKIYKLAKEMIEKGGAPDAR